MIASPTTCPYRRRIGPALRSPQPGDLSGGSRDICTSAHDETVVAYPRTANSYAANSSPSNDVLPRMDS